MAKITTGELYNEWQLINEKLEQLNNKVDDVIENGAINNRPIVELFNEETTVSAGAFIGVTTGFYNEGRFREVFATSVADSAHEYEVRLQLREGNHNIIQYSDDNDESDSVVGGDVKSILPKPYFTERVRLAIRNDDEVDHTYAVRLGVIR